MSSDIKNLLIDPSLNHKLSAPIDKFILKSCQGDIQLVAEIVSDSELGGFILNLRNHDDNDIRNFFPQGTRFSRKDTLSANGILGGKVPIEIPAIFPPSSWGKTIGAVNLNSAKIHIDRINIPANGLETKTGDEIKKMFDDLNLSKADKIVLVPKPDEGKIFFDHFAIICDTKLQFSNTETNKTEEHPFLGKQEFYKRESWVGKALNGDFCLKQKGNHLEIYFCHIASDIETAEKCFDCILGAVGLTHAVNPWPNYLELKMKQKLIKRSIHMPKTLPQGRFKPIDDGLWISCQSAPTNLISSFANLAFTLKDDELETLKWLLWAFRSADNKDLPLSVQILLTCTVIEGACKFFKSLSPPAIEDEDFKNIKKQALEWGKDKINLDEKHRALWTRLNGYISNWQFLDRKEEWNLTFENLFPGNEEWVENMFKLFRDNRHGPAHGSFGVSSGGSDLYDLSRLASFLICAIAAKSGYKGKIISSIFEDKITII